MIPAEDDVDRHAREPLLRAEAGVDDPGMGARRQHRDPAPTHLSGQKPFVDDERIGHDNVASVGASTEAERMVADEPGLVGSRALDGATAEEATTTEQVIVGMEFDRAAGCLQRCQGRLLGQHDERSAG